MDTRLERKELFSGLVDTLNLGVTHERLDDAERVLTCLRALRPRMLELDTFEAWIALKRGYWADAVRLLNNIADSASRGSGLAKALLAFCQCATGDPRWTFVAQQVIDAGDNQEAIRLVRLLLNPEPGADLTSGMPPAAPVATTESSHPIPAVYAAMRV